MSRFPWILAVIALVSSGCKADHAIVQTADGRLQFAGDIRTATGIGAPCDEPADCTKGLTCPSPGDPARLGFCSRLCDYAGGSPRDCGTGASCEYVGAGSWCVPEVGASSVRRVPPVSSDSSTGRVNDVGIGQPCADRRDCTAGVATLCDVGEHGGWDFCTADCPLGVTDAKTCGAEAVCCHAGSGRGRCVPAVDEARLCKPPPEVVQVQIPCCLEGPVNDQGVGKTCATRADCADNKGATSCPAEIRPGLPNWCSHLCEFGDDASCGDDAFCFFRPAASHQGYVGSCTPTACKKSENPPPCQTP